ncbi:MAG: glycosyltransferase family 2 protein [Candidatus Peribacteraceae bacterium]|nr:glycosyltransferase family 2 protein [Candidatus Peribacteraceae bacterium]MBP9850285.1 glycosyltransferase family 2 protein [Candidatus Peribacteraceae bacterium]
MKTSVIILHFSGLDDTRACIQSLLRDGHEDREIFLWDNGSDQRHGDVLKKEFGDAIRVEAANENFGYAGGNNRAAAVAHGEILIFLNNDTEVTPGWMQPLVDALDSDPRLAACQSKLRSLWNPGLFDSAGGAGGYIDAWGYPFVRGRVISLQEEDKGQYDSPTELDWACGACMAVRKKEFLTAGGFDEDFFAYLEEVDLCWKWRREGRSISLVPRSIVLHRGGSTWKNRRHVMLYHKHRNGLLMLLKHLSPAQLLTVLPIRLALEWLAAIFYLTQGGPSQAAAPVRAFFMFFFLAPQTLRKRVHLPFLPLRNMRVLPQYFLQGRTTYQSLVQPSE